MNRILFTADEIDQPLPRSDRRYKHISRILKACPGDCLKAGILDGSTGFIEITHMDTHSIGFKYRAESSPPPLLPVMLICGLPRPQQVKRILRDCTAMGASHIWFPQTRLGEKSYRDSPIWENERWRHLVIDGLEQSGGTVQPDIRLFPSLTTCLETIPSDVTALMLDADHETARSVKNFLEPDPVRRPVAVFIGSERGWTRDEQDQMLTFGCTPVHLGNRILRTDTACIAAIACVAGFLC
ncbi:MAG TPA: 16S rRNA (uracil(1498)-N(3))-methyltransferase [bacterium]|nr:16S rRNA (uracil(1498)-N(3))-methyltransferase [bacterium]